MAIYQLLKEPSYDASGNRVEIETGVKKSLGDGHILLIPFVSDNADYKEYLEWKAAGNTPDPAS